MAKYTVTLNYNASYTMVVEAQDEGQALTLARESCEEADMNQFILGNEKESTCECIG